MISLSLPFPPSLNHYYRHLRTGRTLISEEGRNYRQTIIGLVKPLGHGFTGRLAVTLTCYMPDRRRRDLDNLTKCLNDALTHAGLWGDDSQIDDLRIIRAPVVKGGKVLVTVGELA